VVLLLVECGFLIKIQKYCCLRKEDVCVCVCVSSFVCLL